MTSSVIPAQRTVGHGDSLRHQLIETTVSYMAWSYGAFAASLLAFGLFVTFKWLSFHLAVLVWGLAVMVTSRLISALYAAWKKLPKNEGSSFALTGSTLSMVVRLGIWEIVALLRVVFLSRDFIEMSARRHDLPSSNKSPTRPAASPR